MPLRLAVFAFVREDAREEANTGRLSPCPCYGRKFLEMLVRHGEEEAAQVQEEYPQASARGAARFKPPLKPLRRRSTLSGKAGALARTKGENGASRSG